MECDRQALKQNRELVASRNELTAAQARLLASRMASITTIGFRARLKGSALKPKGVAAVSSGHCERCTASMQPGLANLRKVPKGLAHVDRLSLKRMRGQTFSESHERKPRGYIYPLNV